MRYAGPQLEALLSGSQNLARLSLHRKISKKGGLQQERYPAAGTGFRQIRAAQGLTVTADGNTGRADTSLPVR
jgi:hypothetical protein